MRTLLVRHGPALSHGDAAASGVPDEQRPLTDEGRRRLSATAAAVSTLEPRWGTVLSSPLKRAVESAEILSRAWACPLHITPLLRPGTPARSLESGLGAFAHIEGPLVLVGHAPDLDELAERWLCARATGAIHLGKGALCCLDFPALPAPACGRLNYLIPPGLLRG